MPVAFGIGGTLVVSPAAAARTTTAANPLPKSVGHLTRPITWWFPIPSIREARSAGAAGRCDFQRSDTELGIRAFYPEIFAFLAVFRVVEKKVFRTARCVVSWQQAKLADEGRGDSWSCAEAAAHQHHYTFPSASKRDVKDPSLCLLLLWSFRVSIWPDAVIDIQENDRIELLSLGPQCCHEVKRALPQFESR